MTRRNRAVKGRCQHAPRLRDGGGARRCVGGLDGLTRGFCLRGGHRQPCLGLAKRSGRLIEFLRGGRARGVQAGDACVSGTGERHARLGSFTIGGNDACVGAGAFKAGPRASRLRAHFSGVEFDQRLSPTDPFAGAHKDPHDGGHDPAGDFCGVTRHEHAARLEGGGHRRRLHAVHRHLQRIRGRGRRGV